jgi:C4-dicarboxylate transporter DctM subunit
MTIVIVVLLMLFLASLGIWTGVALTIAGVVGLFLSFGEQALLRIGAEAWNLANSDTLVAIPLFILMGELLGDSRGARDLFNFISRFDNVIPSSRGIATVAFGGMLSSVAGSLAAVTAITTKTSYRHLREAGLPTRQSLGLVTSVGALGIMLPPSLTLIIFGSLTQNAIASLFRAAIVPGIVQMLLFMLVIGWLWNRHLKSSQKVIEKELEKKSSTFGAAWQLPSAILLVLGGFLSGKLTPIEAAASGVVAAVGMNFLNGEIIWSRLSIATRNTILSTSMILLIVLGAQMISSVLAYEGFARSVSLFVKNLAVPDLVILFAIVVLYLILGTVFDGLSMMVLTLPFIYPIVLVMGRDPVWFGVVMVACVQIAELSPPVGVNLFVAQYLTGEAIEEVWWGIWPYAVAIGLVLVTLVLFPRFGLLLVP